MFCCTGVESTFLKVVQLLLKGKIIDPVWYDFPPAVGSTPPIMAGKMGNFIGTWLFMQDFGIFALLQIILLFIVLKGLIEEEEEKERSTVAVAPQEHDYFPKILDRQEKESRGYSIRATPWTFSIFQRLKLFRH